MAPIRVGLIGLSTAANPFAPGAWAANSHLPGLRTSPNFEIVALCNSSVEKGEISKAHHKLDAKVRCYGSPEELAADPEVDLVAVSVHVSKHYELAKPALEHGKNVYVEWPLGATLAESEELAALAKKKGVKTVVGAQGRADPAVIKAREILQEGKIGKILSSIVTINRSEMFNKGWPQSAAQYLTLASSANLYHIQFGHFFDSFLHVLGPLSNLKASLKLNYPTVTTLDEAQNVVDPKFPKSLPDDIYVQAELASGAPISINARTVRTTMAESGFRWLVSGTEGEIEITAPEFGWQMGGLKLRMKIGDEEAKEVDLDQKIFGVDVANAPAPGTNVARLYEAFAAGREPTSTFESAVESHRTLDNILKSAGWT